MAEIIKTTYDQIENLLQQVGEEERPLHDYQRRLSNNVGNRAPNVDINLERLKLVRTILEAVRDGKTFEVTLKDDERLEGRRVVTFNPDRTAEIKPPVKSTGIWPLTN